MTARVSLLPHPGLSSFLLVLWLLLNNSAAPGHLVLGALLGVLIPLFTRRFWPERLGLARPGLMLRFSGRVLWDILVANFAVARVVLGPRSAIRPAFVRVPLDIHDDFPVTVLASVVSLTPGTVSADIDAERRNLLVHALSVSDTEALAQDIKARYEAPIKEIFAC
ncbi:MAG: Na+/H+ antiporter subunit E [Gammaproteobacteria bacterium]|nr:Na+/H+ antiporter subunit E [Gammaproteobacteria bacterium]